MLKKIAKSGNTKGYVLHEPEGYSTGKKYPTVLFFHGIGERGDGTDSGLENLYKFIDSPYYPFKEQLSRRNILLIAIQLPWDKTYWPLSYVEDALAIAKKYAVDESKFYLSGVSLGGGAVWGYAAASLENGKKFAAILACCCVGASGTWANIKSPVLAYHATNDPVVGVGNSDSIVKSINAGNPPEPAKLKTTIGGMNLSGHEIWGLVYGNNEAWDWLLSKSAASTPAPIEPLPPEAEKEIDFTIVYYTDGTFSKVE